MNTVMSRSEQLQHREEFVAEYAGMYALRLSRVPSPTKQNRATLQASIGRVMARQRTAKQLKNDEKIGVDVYPYMSSRMYLPNGITTIQSSALHALQIESQRKRVGVIGLENIITSPSEIPSAISHVLSPDSEVQSMTTPIATVELSDESFLNIKRSLSNHADLTTNAPARVLLILTKIVSKKIKEYNCI